MSSLQSKPNKLYKGHMIAIVKEKLTLQDNNEFEALLESILDSKFQTYERKDVIFRLGKESLFGEGIRCTKNPSEGNFNIELIGHIEKPPKIGEPLIYKISESSWREYPQDLFESLNYR